jgi:hypothetical protein
METPIEHDRHHGDQGGHLQHAARRDQHDEDGQRSEPDTTPEQRASTFTRCALR